MTAPAGHPSLRASIAHALGDILAEHSQRQIAETLGVASTTIMRRGEDLSAWPATDLLRLACAHPDLAETVVTYLRGDQQPQGQAVAVIGDLHTLLADGGTLISQAAAALTDGVVTASEARDLRATINRAIGHLSMAMRDLAVIEQGATRG